MNLEVSIQELDEAHGFGLTHNGAYYKIGPLFGQLHGLIHSQNIPAIALLGAYYVDPRTHEEADLRSMAAFTVPDDFAGTVAGLEPFRFEGGRYLVGTFTGSYQDLPSAWQHFVSKSVEEHNVKPTEAPSYENYLHHDEHHPENCVTQLLVRIE